MAKVTNVKIITASEKAVLWYHYQKWTDEIQTEHYNIEVIQINQDEDDEKFYLVITFYIVDHIG